MLKPSKRTWRFYGRVFSDTPSINMTVMFNSQTVFDGEIDTDFSMHDLNNNWNKLWLEGNSWEEYIFKNHKILFETELDYSLTGLIPLKIIVNSPGRLLYSTTMCNYTSSNTTYYTEPDVTFSSSCNHSMDNRRNVLENNNDLVAVAPHGVTYHINNEFAFNCDIQVEKEYLAWLPASLATRFNEFYRKDII